MILYKAIEHEIMRTTEGTEDMHIRYYKRFAGAQAEVRIESYDGGLSAGAYVVVAGINLVFEVFLVEGRKRCIWSYLDNGNRIIIQPERIQQLAKNI